MYTVEALNAWTDPSDDPDEANKKKERKLPLGYTRFRQRTRGPTTGWRLLFDSEADNFNLAIGLVIFLNAIVIGLETDYGRKYFIIFEHMFCFIFLFEMLARLGQIGPEYFQESWYIFDCSLVVMGSLDLWILPVFRGPAHGGTGYELSVLRLLRMLRLLRILRLIRIFRMFHHLLLIVKAFGNAVWVSLLMGLIVLILVYSLSIVCTQLVGHHKELFDDADEVGHLFGTIERSMLTLLSIMFGSEWLHSFQLLEKAFPTGLVLAVFAMYMVIALSLISLIVGLITEALLFVHEDFKHRKMQAFASKKKELAASYQETLKVLFKSDEDKDGGVTGLVLRTELKNNKLANWMIRKLTEVGVALTIDGFFALIDEITANSTKRVTIEYFIEMLMNLAGESQASAFVDLKYEVLKDRQYMAELEEKLDRYLRGSKVEPLPDLIDLNDPVASGK